MQEQIKFGFVILNFLTYDDTYALIESLIASSDISRFSVNIYVADNQSDPNKLEHLQQRCLPLYSEITFLGSEDNLGFARGMNLGVTKALRDGCQFVVCSNNDILVKECALFQHIAETFQQEPNVAVIGPSILNMNTNEDQNPYIPRRSMDNPVRLKLYSLYYEKIFGKFLFYSIELLKRLRTFISPLPPKKPLKTKQYIYCVHGSFFILTPAYFQYFSELDPQTFLYFEEYIIAERVHQKKLKELVNPSITVAHKDDSSTDTFFRHNQWKKLLFVLANNYRSGKYFYHHYIKPNLRRNGK